MRTRPRLAIFIQTPREDAWFAAIQADQARAVANESTSYIPVFIPHDYLTQ